MGRQWTSLLWAGVLAVVAAAAAAQCPVTCVPPEVYRWRTGCEVPPYSMDGYTRIHTIQGSKHTSDFEGQVVTTIGSVTGRVSNGFFLQDVYEDCDDSTSEGIFVFTGSPVSYARYQVVEVTGVVEEVSYGSSLPMTTIRSSNHEIVYAGRVEPNPHQFWPLGKLSRFGSYEEDRSKPRTDLRDLECSAPATDAICQYEQREGMLMKIRSPIAAGTSKADETAVIRDGPDMGSDNTDFFGGAVIKPWTVQDYVGEAVIIRDEIKQSKNFPIGTTFRRIKGILTLDTDGNMAMWPTYKLEEVKAAPATPPPRCPAQSPGSTLRVATYDLTDYCKGRSKLDGIADQIADGLDCPDVIALQSVGDDSCNTNNGVVSAQAGLSDLTAALNQNSRCGGSGKQYSALQVNPKNRKDGGRDGFNGRVVVLYNLRKLIHKARSPAGVDPSTKGTTVVNGKLTINPGRVSPSSAAFDGEHKTLAVEFQHTSGKVFVVVNHWNTRDADDGVFAASQPPVQHSQVKREQMQSAVSAFLKTIPKDAAAVFVLGNLNDFYWSQPVKLLRTKSGTQLESLWKKINNKERYSYYELGRFMPLDHILVRKKTDFNKCNLCALRANTMAGQNALSDHDPLVAECSGFDGDVPN